MPFDVIFDFPTLLSILLAVFSVGLAAMFYFKATETSNAFYDNTYKFSKDISDLLSRMESGFGERLRHLDDSYSGMRNRLEKYPVSESKTEDAQNELKASEDQLKETLHERDKLIKSLIARSRMENDEKSDFLQHLKKQERDLEHARQDIRLLKKQIRIASSNPGAPVEVEGLTDRMHSYLCQIVLPILGEEFILDGSFPLLRRQFRRFKHEFAAGFINDMTIAHFCNPDGDLTAKGGQLLRSLARSSLAIKKRTRNLSQTDK